MRHDHRSQHAHDDEQRALRHGRHHGTCRCLPPVYVNQKQLIDERQADERHKAYDGALHTLVRIGEEHDENGHSDKYGARGYADAQQHLQGYGASQYLCQRRGYAGQQRRHHDGAPQPARSILHGGLAEAQSRHYAQVGNVVLKGNEHDGGERYHPQ